MDALKKFSVKIISEVVICDACDTRHVLCIRENNNSGSKQEDTVSNIS